MDQKFEGSLSYIVLSHVYIHFVSKNRTPHPKSYEVVPDSQTLSKMLKKQIHKYIKLHKLMEWNYLMNTEVILISEY